MKKLALLLLLAVPAIAAPSPLFAKYEAARQALLGNSIPAIQTAARNLAAGARAAKLPALAEKSDILAKTASVKDARLAFAAVSDEAIRFRSGQPGDRPQVVYCPMEKKSWLQPKGAITNPYVDASMRACGEVKEP